VVRPELVLIYNDAYKHVLDEKHPAALGRPGAEVWSEIWPEIAPMFERIRGGGPPVFDEDARFVTRRTGDPDDVQDAWFTFSLSPVRPQLASKALRYRQEACDPALRVRADPEKVWQVLLNFLANAVKFTDPGGSVSVSSDVDDTWVRVHVGDTGRGLAPAQLVRVFDAFVQVDRHLTPASQQGVGLGLAISRDLAVGMGGTLSAESTPGQGSTFTLALPRA
jgi:signal transduction histidine kinase